MKTYFHQFLPFAAILSFAAFCLLSIHQPIEYFEINGSLPPAYAPFLDWQIVASSDRIDKHIDLQNTDGPDDQGRFTVSVFAPVQGPAYLYLWKDGFARQRFDLPIDRSVNNKLQLDPLIFTGEKIMNIPSNNTAKPTATIHTEPAKPRTVVIYNRDKEEIYRVPADQLSFFHLQPHEEATQEMYFGHLGIYDERERETIKYNKFFRFSRIPASPPKYTDERRR